MHRHDAGAHDEDLTQQTAGTVKRLAIVLSLAASYSLAEMAGGLWTGSLALLADAWHLVSDVAALGLSLFALWISRRPASIHRTFGHARAEILAALANGTALLAIALFIVFEAVDRLGSETPIEGLGVMGFAAGALVVNTTGLFILNGGRKHNLNVRGAWLHVLSDALGSVAVILAGALIWRFGWTWADPLASLMISGLVMFSSFQLIREAIDVLMETAPRHLDLEAIRGALGAVPGVRDIHDLHVWTLGGGEVSLSSHVVKVPGTNPDGLLAHIHEALGRDFGIRHATVQIEGLPQAERCRGDCRTAPGTTLAAS